MFSALTSTPQGVFAPPLGESIIWDSYVVCTDEGKGVCSKDKHFAGISDQRQNSYLVAF